MLLFIFFAGMLFLGGELAHLLWRADGDAADGEAGIRDDAVARQANVSLLERLTTSGVLASASAVATGWLLSAFRLLDAPALTAAGVLACVAATLLRLRRPRSGTPASLADDSVVPLLAMLPLLLFFVFVLWRSVLLPTLNHDAMSYHLPKAVLMMRAGGYAWFEAPDPRITTFPSNYELLLAEDLILDGSDRVTEWIGGAMFLLFLIASTAMIERWWGSGRYLFGVPLLLASAPVLLLHAGADKNDLMAVTFFVAAAMWGSRWIARGGRGVFVLGAVASWLAVGTKSHGCIVAMAIAVAATHAIVRDVRRRPSPRQLAAIVALLIACVFLLGGVPYLATMWHRGLPIDARVAASAAGAAPKPSTVEYGAWSNLWQFPLLLWLAPFQRLADYIWIPWKGEAWFWPRYEIFFSNYGEPISLAMLLIPFGAKMRRDRELSPETARERNVATSVLLATAILILPLTSKPIGGFAAFPRYLAFTLPLIAGWSYAPLARALERRGRIAALHAVLVLCCVAFCVSAVRVVRNDRFAPLEYVMWMLDHRGSRRPWFEDLRAGVVVDAMAGPFDHIAFDTEFDSWIYPAYGAAFSRKVSLVPNGAGLGGVPPDAEWVAIDREWNVAWGHPRFRTYGDYARYIGKGRPTAGDLLLFRQLLTDPRYRLVFYAPRRHQAIFQRVTTVNRDRSPRLPPLRHATIAR